MPKILTIKQKGFIPAKPLEIYNAFLNAKKHSEFTGSRATCSTKIGGKFTAWDGYVYGRNLELKAGKKIVQEWQTTEWPADAAPSKLTLTFVAKKNGTEMTLVHTNVPAEQAASYKKGWIDFYWNPLKKFFKK